jgi:energy-coupling factor transport system ATP-binding protein
MTAPLLEVERVTFRYRRATEPALRDVSLSLEAGEVLLVAGPSGCGKSTLIRAINGLIPHAYPGELTGSVRIEGRKTAELRLREIARVVGTMLQDPAKQIVGSTTESEIAFGPENLGIARETILARIGEVIDLVGIDRLRGRETAALSGGELQLLAMAGTLVMQPGLLVIDEPLANLDPLAAHHLLALLRRLADGGHGVVIVEHRVEEALELRPDSVLYLDDGRTKYQGPLDGFLAVADPESVRLPFEVILARERARPTDDSRDEYIEAAGPRVDEPAETAESAVAHSPARLELRELDVELGSRPVLHHLSAALGSRETVAILGPNGSGKTTMFRTAMGLVRPSAGQVLVDGRDTAGRAVAALATVFGFVFQSPSQMLFARTIRDELLFGPRNLGLPVTDPDLLCHEVLRRTALDEVVQSLDRPPLTLSFGQQKRLALAIGLTLSPATLLLDEPSAGQDHATAARFMAEVLAIPGLESIYFVTHDVDLALTHADRILVLRDGEVAADGPPLEVVKDRARWESSNLRYTSLITANLAQRAGNRFLDAVTLARRIALAGRDGPGVGGGGQSPVT